jgi:putative peptide maturation dehydrogenase
MSRESQRMRIRRCSILLIEPRERVEFDFDSLLTGGNGLRAERQWIALAPHLEQECILSAEEVLLLGSVSSHEWTKLDILLARHNRELLDGLVAKGLLIGDASSSMDVRARDDALRATHWYASAAVVHAFGRWQGVTAGKEVRNIGIRSLAELVDRLGAPPTHFHSRSAPEERITLARPQPTAIDTLLRRRATCRNFDLARDVPFSIFSHLLHRTFGAQATHEVNAETAVVKKTSPSAGGLHPTEAYLLIQRVENVAPGLYHYHVGEHSLEPLQVLAPDEALALAERFVAEQDWFARAHALVVLAARFPRSSWKYRAHAKSYRAVTLDVGHLSQTLQISATEFGLGAFVTAAINEVDIEQVLGFRPMEEGPLAVCGFGWRAAERNRMEFDPQHAVWPSD